MWNWSVDRGMLAEPEQRLAVDPHLLPDRAGARLELSRRRRRRAPPGTGVWVVNTLWARTWRTASSNGVPGHDQLAQPLDHHERGVAFVGVPDGRVDAQRAQHPHAADAENPLLPQRGARARRRTACSSGRGRPGGWPRGWCRAGRSAPGPPSSARRGRGPGGPEVSTVVRYGSPLRPAHRLERRQRDVELVVAVLLPAVEPEPLVEVALHVDEARRRPAGRRGRSRPCSGRRPARRGRRSRSAPSCAARTRRRSRPPAGRRARG